MDGFATVDLSAGDNSLTVWLTSAQQSVRVAHTNAVTFAVDDQTVPRRAWSMMFARYVVLTDRTPHNHPLLISLGTQPCDLAMMARQTTAAQATVMAAFAVHSAKPGKANLIEPSLPPLPLLLDQAELPADDAAPL